MGAKVVMKMSCYWGLVCIMAGALLMWSVKGEVNCPEAVENLLPCKSYLMGNDEISIPCCKAAESVRDMVNSLEDRIAMCECFKFTGIYMQVNLQHARNITRVCQLTLNFAVDTSDDCTKGF